MRKKAPKKEITLMTLLASEATKEARQLLKKYKKPDAKGFDDLEVKLAELYTSSNDKFGLEKEMAEIHPHKNWLIKRLELDKPKEVKVEKVEVETTKEAKPQTPSVVCGNPFCPIHGITPICEYSNASGSMNNPFATTQGKPNTSEQSKDQAPPRVSPMDYVGIIGMVAIVGITFFVITKTVK
jgi:hypothetical protein